MKPRLLGHFGTTPGLNLVYAHMNRAIAQRDLDAIYVAGPGHGGPGLVANAYLEGTYSEVYPHVGRRRGRACDELFRQFSFPGGIPSHVAPETPGSIHEGGELGYALTHAYGAAFDNPDLVVCCVVGDGEAETGPLATSWHSNKFLNPRTRRRRPADPAPERLQDRQPDRARAHPARTSCARCSTATAGAPLVVAGDEPEAVHQPFAAALDEALDEIARDPGAARARRRERAAALADDRPAHAEGLDRPEGGRRHAGRGHVALAPGAARRRRATNPSTCALLEEWLRSYRPEELFDEDGALVPSSRRSPPRGERRMSANPHANGGVLLRDLVLPGLPRLRGRRRRPRRRRPARRRACWARSCAT